MKLLSALLLSGCIQKATPLDPEDERRSIAQDTASTPADSGSAPDDSDSVPTDSEDSAGGTDSPIDKDTHEPTEPSDDTDTTEPGGSRENPRSGVPGEWAITELMINPAATGDEVGEWVELLNLSDDWLTLEGHVLADDDMDLATISGPEPVVIAPGAAAVICANTDAALNGGVACDASFTYLTGGGGFALANSGDEVLLLNSEVRELDSLRYSEKLVPAGASFGVSPIWATAEGNDDLSQWCAQSSKMASGDRGTPGASNDPC